MVVLPSSMEVRTTLQESSRESKHPIESPSVWPSYCGPLRSRRRLEKLTFEEITGQPVAFTLYQFGLLRGVGKPLKRNYVLVAEARYAPNRQLLAIPFRSELIHCAV